MERFEIATALTSLAQPGVQFCKPAEAKTLARRCNDYAAELNAKHGKRFGAFGTVPMWDMRDATQEIAYCLDTVKFAGVSLFASYDGKFLGDPKFDPVMEALNARDGVVFVHPGAHPTNKLIDLPWPAFMMEYLFDTTRAVVNLVFGGALEKYPRVKFILPHAGGLVPYFSWRLSVSPLIDKRLNQMSREHILGLLRRFWYDNALSPGAQTWGCLENVAAPEQIVFGTDWPFANVRVTAEAVQTYEALPAIAPAQRAAIDRGNALRLFPQLA
jgi:predicted TIM-barrel fold metal-dependent hydrolase